MKVEYLVYVLIACFVFSTIASTIVMNKEVTTPYMDEVFHFAMTQRYFEGIACKQ